LHSPDEPLAVPARRRGRRPWEITRYSAGARQLLYRSIPLVAAVRLALWALPTCTLFQHAARWAEHAERHPSRGRPTEYYVAWAVRAAGRRVPRASCLTQALAGQILLGMYGFTSTIRIGVAREAGGAFVAHAWLEVGSHERPLIGDRIDLERYTRLPDVAEVAAHAGLRL
jgi:hypothetical protein